MARMRISSNFGNDCELKPDFCFFKMSNQQDLSRIQADELEKLYKSGGLALFSTTFTIEGSRQKVASCYQVVSVVYMRLLCRELPTFGICPKLGKNVIE